MSAHAASCKWVGPDGGAWNTPSNWSTKTVPGANDDVVIEGKKKVAVPVDATVANLTVGSGAEIKNGGKIKVTGKTTSSGLFTGAGTLDVPAGATAVYNVDSSNLLATVTGTTPPVVFAPINNNGSIITKVASGCRVDFASVQNSGSTQITSDGTVTFKDIKNAKSLDISGAGNLVFSKIDNATGASLSIATTASSVVGGVIRGLSGKTTTGLLSGDSSVIRLDDLTNRSGGKIKLSGEKGGRYFDGKSINNQGEMQISGAQTLLEADVTNGPGATLFLDSDATLFPSDNTAPKLNNSGKIIKSANSDATLSVEWTNTGQIIVDDGTLHVRVPAGKGCKQTDGVTTLEGGTFSVENAAGESTSTFEVAGGIINGIGTIAGNVVNSGGHFKPGHSPGTITINGSYFQTANCILDMELGGTTPGTGYDQLIVNGTAYLGGTLNMIRWNDFTPQDGDVYTLLTYYAKSGNFANFTDALPVQGIVYDTTLTPTDLELNCYNLAMDITSPTISITSPASSGAARSFTTATGKASDTNGLSKVTCRLYRYANSVTGVAAGYWAGGSTWTSSATASNDRAASGTTSWTFTFPTLVAGRYSLTSTATDIAGNTTSTPAISFWVDPNAPSSLTISSPANGSTVSSLGQIGGTVSDAADGSGITIVRFQLKRTSDGAFWNGSAWTSTAYSFGTTLSGTNWSRSSSTISSIAVGQYSIIATATDRAGNTKTVTSNFTVGSSTTSSTKIS